eukprot:CAMPEP_0197857844 /NCGR_PEP_ID=MMETSP1438-20131217/31251_1 /TAXON_ID=1461541 /ORGANISM="Pterosperma sp., Strain CCMP1384" /LENGTH=102 /DNA_ID=CAMNT_0043473821 /DNA_START=101 /DNA_END=409 /DNA_ORIENTATION=-
MSVRRHKDPVPELKKEACKLPPKAKKIKNVAEDELGETYGRVYLPSQNIDEIALMKPKGLKREKRAAKAEREAEGGAKKKQKKANNNDDDDMHVQDVDEDDQ